MLGLSEECKRLGCAIIVLIINRFIVRVSKILGLFLGFLAHILLSSALKGKHGYVELQNQTRQYQG